MLLFQKCTVDGDTHSTSLTSQKQTGYLGKEGSASLIIHHFVGRWRFLYLIVEVWHTLNLSRYEELYQDKPLCI